MTYFALGIVFAAIGFVVATTVLSLVTVLVWRVGRGRIRRADTLFVLRMAPSIGAAATVLGVVVPAFVAFEPRKTGETAGIGLLAFVAVAAVLMLAGAYRAAGSWFVTRRLERIWRRVARPADVRGMLVPTYRVPSDLPFAALVGLLRPRLFVSDRFFDALSAEERRAVLRHEAGHAAAFDNLKRAAMRLAPDWLAFTAAGRGLEAEWAIAVEEAADDHAARFGEGLAVAGALLKASRFGAARLVPVSNFCDGATIARRVARLLDDAPAGNLRTSRSRAAWLAAVLGAAALAAGPSLPLVYAAIELVVHELQ